ncbi:hypothetical protein AB0J86_14905 [Micromonospora sp. NPDC049559]|uniref:hypothetical protein n=1 Tax=Micromonospora sp. NPDC049559 TaxID=3155923 RepID=UPI00342C5BF5
MFGTNLLDRRSKPERIADQAWAHLMSAVSSAGDAARSTTVGAVRSAKRGTSHLTDEAGDLVGSAAEEAWQRARNAFDALAGRRPGLPWAWLIGAGLAGAAIGWAAGTAARAAAARREEAARTDSTDSIEFVEMDRADSPMPLGRANSSVAADRAH